MIIADRKPFEEIKAMVAPFNRILVLGCGTCVTVDFSGGEKQVGILASELRMARKLEGKPIETVEFTVQRQCEWEFIDPIAEMVRGVDAVLSMACGVGVQAMAERYPDKIILPALNTVMMGMPIEAGVFVERCAGCGNCVLALTGGICPIARCSKSLLNGPCGGSQNGKCEVNPDIDCAWQLIYDKLKAMGKLDALLEIMEPKDWRPAGGGGPRKIIREEVKLETVEE